MIGKRYFQDKRHILIIVIIALFNFVFLGLEYLFDNIYGMYATKEEVVIAQNIVLGISSAGFLMYGFLADKIRKKQRIVLNFVISVVFVAGVAGLNVLKTKVLILIIGAFVFLILGLLGSAICFYASTHLSSLKNLAKTVGFGYAVGILFQFINNNLVRNNIIQSFVYVVAFCILFYVTYKLAGLEKVDSKDERLEIRSAKYSAIALIGVTALLTLIFSTLDNSVTMVHASGNFDIGQWPRLILALSGISAGFIYDIKGRRIMPFAMYAISVLSVLCIVVVDYGGPFILGLLVFYISAGFFVVFFMTAFMEFSYYSAKPKVWAGLGRAINNIFACASAPASVYLLNKESHFIIFFASLILFILISFMMFMFYNFSETHQLNENEVKTSMVVKSNNMEMFAEKYGLTKRELEVLSALVKSNSTVSETAKELAISRAALYRHIANMNEKTNTANRIELMHLFNEKSSE